MKNLVFVSGPHGAGKSSLIRKLLGKIPNSISPELETKTPQFYWGTEGEETNYFHRQALKEAHRAMEGYEYLRASKVSPERIVIGDRCIHDSAAYRIANVKLGWMTQEQAEEIEKITKVLYPPELTNPNLVILNPSFQTLRKHLQKRWEEEGKSWKFKERDMEYLESVHKSFEELKELENSIYIGNEFTLRDIERIIEWIKNN